MCIRLVFPDVDASKQICGRKNPTLWHKSISHRSSSVLWTAGGLEGCASCSSNWQAQSLTQVPKTRPPNSDSVHVVDMSESHRLWTDVQSQPCPAHTSCVILSSWLLWNAVNGMHLSSRKLYNIEKLRMIAYSIGITTDISLIKH